MITELIISMFSAINLANSFYIQPNKRNGTKLEYFHLKNIRMPSTTSVFFALAVICIFPYKSADHDHIIEFWQFWQRNLSFALSTPAFHSSVYVYFLNIVCSFFFFCTKTGEEALEWKVYQNGQWCCKFHGTIKVYSTFFSVWWMVSITHS